MRPPEESMAGVRLALERYMEDDLPAARALRRRLHAEAEISHQENETRRTLSRALGGAIPVAERSLLFRLGPDDRPEVVLRAEMDALPMDEKTGAEYASTSGAMHSCGHDIHMAALVCVLKAIARVQAALPLSVAGLFQHSEELYPLGGRQVAESGALSTSKAIVAAHVHPDIPFGEVACDPGPVNAALDFFRIVIQGTPGHGAYPHRSKDAISALCDCIATLQQVVPRSIDPLHAAVVTVGQIEGGSAPNAFPAEAVAAGTFRTLNPEDRNRLQALLPEVVKHVAKAWGCEGEVVLTPGEPAVVNDEALAVATRHELEDWGMKPARQWRSCGSDDFGFYGEIAPSVMMFVGVRGRLLGPLVPLHHPEFLPGDEAVEAVARSYLSGLMGALTTLE
ncbi:MAG TPA: M20 family metallopeptidase [Actinomycetota bacterium]|nr:M20 family metallopeptidase [Actinomycetota bacterium]